MGQLVAVDSDLLLEMSERLERIEARLEGKTAEEWLERKEFAKRIGRSVATVNRRIASGELETKDVCGVVYVRADL